MERGIVVTKEERLKKAEMENREFRARLEKQTAALEYMAVCSYPEILEDNEAKAGEACF